MVPYKRAIYQTEQIREFETLAVKRFKIDEQTMMHRAGLAACEFLIEKWPHAKKIAVFCGRGNNGGDGYVLANLAHKKGMDVTVWQIGEPDQTKKEAYRARELCFQNAISVKMVDEKSDFGDPDVIVDAICGIGIQSTLRNNLLTIIERIQKLSVPILAIDVPTGINADTGSLLGNAIRANATITFIGQKLGLLTGSGTAFAGDVEVNDLQFPPQLAEIIKPVAEVIHLNDYKTYLKPRTRDWHKGRSGHVLIIGGDKGFSGATRMAGEAALRVGAGLVTIATHPSHASMLNLTCPELMCNGISSPEDLNSFLAKADILVVGPGLGQSTWSKSLWDHVKMSEKPLVVDADGLNLLAHEGLSNDHWVLTPHPGEAGRLLSESNEVVQADRLQALKKIQNKYHGTCVLKGAGSLIAANSGLPALCDQGNPGMATAGMGDILSGVIGGLMAQKIPNDVAAKLGVCLHAAAGDLAAQKGERGMIATDLMPYIRRLSNIFK